MDKTYGSDFDRVGDKVFVPDELFQADIAIVFGITTWRRPVEKAVALYRSGLARRLLFTGGFNPRIDAIEAAAMADEALRLAVPAADILVEDQATNTSENLDFSRRCIEANLGLETINSILLVAIQFHMRRVLMTARRALPPSIRLGTAAYPSVFYTEHDWRDSERGRRDVASEVDKIRLYLAPDWTGAEA